MKPEFFTIPTNHNIIYKNYKSFIKNNILEENKISKNEKCLKSSLSLKNKDLINILNNSLIRINSEKNINDNNKILTNINNTNGNINGIKIKSKNDLSYTNLYAKQKFPINDSKLFFNLLNRRKIQKKADINEFRYNNYINSNSSSFSLLNESNYKTIYDDKYNNNINNNNKVNILLKRKGFDDKKFLNCQSNIYKFDYIKKIIRKYYFENFLCLKDYFNYINYINVNSNNFLTIEDFVYFLKEIVNISLDKNEIRYLLNSNNIIKVDFNCFKYIFFPEQINNKLINLILKNKKSNSSIINKKFKFKNNYSCIAKIRKKNDDNLPSIEKRVYSFENIDMKQNPKLKINNKILNINKDINNDPNSFKPKVNLKKIRKINVYINNLYINFIKNKNKNKNNIVKKNKNEINKESVIKLNIQKISKDTENINKKKKSFNKSVNIINDNNKNNKNKITDNNKNNKKEITITNIFVNNKKKNDDIKKEQDKKLKSIDNEINEKNIESKSKTQRLFSYENRNNKNKISPISKISIKNNNLKNAKNSKNANISHYRDLFTIYRNNGKLFFMNKNNILNNKMSLDDSKNKEKNSDILKIL